MRRLDSRGPLSVDEVGRDAALSADHTLTALGLDGPADRAAVSEGRDVQRVPVAGSDYCLELLVPQAWHGLTDETEPDREPVEVRVDGKRGATQGVHEDAARCLGTDTGQGLEVGERLAVGHPAERSKRRSTEVVAQLAEDCQDPRRLLVGETSVLDLRAQGREAHPAYAFPAARGLPQARVHARVRGAGRHLREDHIDQVVKGICRVPVSG